MLTVTLFIPHSMYFGKRGGKCAALVLSKNRAEDEVKLLLTSLEEINCTSKCNFNLKIVKLLNV